MAPGKQRSILERLAQRPPSLEGGIELRVDSSDGQRGVVRLRHGDVSVELHAAGLSVPYPSGLRRLRASQPDIDLIVAERIPPGLQKAAADEGLSCIDLGGRGRVVAPGLVYVASPRPELSGKVARSRSSPFAPKASRVVRVLLSDPGRAWRLSDVAALADLNPGNVHRALGALVDLGMVERDEDAYVVADPGSLLEAWGDQAQPSRDQVRLRSDGELRDFVRNLVDQFDGDAVVSGELAAEELAPYLPAESAVVHCLDADHFAALARAEVDRPRLRFGVAPGEVLVDLADEGYGAFCSERSRLPIASPVQIYVDLAGDRGRGREAGEHLRQSVLGF